jgi:hypothetical protein
MYITLTEHQRLLKKGGCNDHDDVAGARVAG